MIAQTIAHQIGIPAFALLGAHTLVDLEDGLQFHIRGCSKINIIQIILDPSDTYTVKFGKLEYQKNAPRSDRARDRPLYKIHLKPEEPCRYF